MRLDSGGIPNKKMRTKENDDMEDIFANDSKFFRDVLKIDDMDKMTDEQYVDCQIRIAKQFFNIDRGATEAKKINLGDIKSTKIESPAILSIPIFDPKINDPQIKKQTPVQGNIKAIVPIMRERYTLEYVEVGGLARPRYKRVGLQTIKEKRIFGIMTAKQPGHIPNL